MSISSAFTIANTVVTVNGRAIDDWGSADPAFTDSPIDPKRVLVRALGGNATVLERINNGRRVTLSLRTGSADASYLHALYMSGATITLTRSQVGSIDSAIGTEGVIVNEPDVSRVATSQISDDVFEIEFNVWESTKGE